MRRHLAVTGSSIVGWQRRENLIALLLLAPAVLYLLAMAVYPTIYSLWLAVHNYTLYRPEFAPYVGFANFTYLFGDELFRRSLRVTVVFALAAVALEFAIGLWVAVLLDRKMVGINLLRTLLIIPVLISPVGMGLTFRYIFAPGYGLLNSALRAVGLHGVDFIVSTTWALPAVIAVDVWQWTPFVTLILLAGMQSVSVEVVEAAELDGLNEWQKLWRIVLPLIRPVIIVILLIRLIDAVRTFDLVFVLTRGGPGSSTEVLSILSYETGFTSGDMGTASAVAWITIVLVNVLVIFFLRALSKPGR